MKKPFRALPFLKRGLAKTSIFVTSKKSRQKDFTKILVIEDSFTYSEQKSTLCYFDPSFSKDDIIKSLSKRENVSTYFLLYSTGCESFEFIVWLNNKL